MAEKIENESKYLVYEKRKLSFFEVAYLCGGYFIHDLPSNPLFNLSFAESR